MNSVPVTCSLSVGVLSCVSIIAQSRIKDDWTTLVGQTKYCGTVDLW